MKVDDSTRKRKTRNELKKTFGEGQRATSEGFAELIDSMVNVIDDQVEGKLELVSAEENDAAIEFKKNRIDTFAIWKIAMNSKECLIISKAEDNSPCLILHPDKKIETGNNSCLTVNGKLYTNAIVGNAKGEKTVLANAKWHELFTSEKGIRACEVTASCKTDRHNLPYIIYRAVATQCDGKPTHLKAESIGWKSFFRAYIQFRWTENAQGCALQVRTKKNYKNCVINISIKDLI